MYKKSILFFSLLLQVFAVCSQGREEYLNNEFKATEPAHAAYFRNIEKTDSGWLQSDFLIGFKALYTRCLYADSNCTIANGPYYMFYPDKSVRQHGRYANNEKEGLWVGYHHNGELSDSANYAAGVPQGITKQWYANGFPADSTAYSDDGKAVKVSWFNDGVLSSAGRLNAMQQMHGKWQFYHHNGTVSASEVYDNGKLVDRKYFSEDGSALADTTDKTRGVEFPGGNSAWANYLGAALGRYMTPASSREDKKVTAIQVLIDVDLNGRVEHVEFLTPHQADFDRAVLQTVSGKKWLPAIDHNRKIPATRILSLHLSN